MPDHRHTSECAARTEAAEAARAAFRKLWPEACQDCHGDGGAYAADLVTGLQAWQECFKCAAYGQCPRCGTEDALTSIADPVCSNCGWDVRTPGEPQVPPCACQPPEDRHD